MIFDRSDSDQSHFMQALVPMVDLFAVLAIVFMIYSDDEITVTKLESEKRIQEIVTEVQEARKKLAEIDEAERARIARRVLLAKKASKSLEQIKEERERKARELITQINEMLAAQQSESDMDYEAILAGIESKYDEELEKEATFLEKEKQAELEKTEQELKEQAQRETAKLKLEKTLALAKAEQERLDALAKQEAELEKQRQLELAKTEQELKAQAEREAAKLKKEKALALAEADQERQAELSAQKSALEKEKAKALSEKEQAFADKLDQQKKLLAQVAEELTPFVQALEAKKKIVEELNENFKDFDPSAVEIDKKTGKVKLHFQKSYFARGSHILSEDMKSFLRIVIPKYAKAIYGNKDAAEHIKTLKISGMTSPVYGGVYIDINDKSPETERARKYNMALSTRRARALYDFIFDKDEMGDFEYRSQLKADMSIEALGFKHATPVPAELVGKPAECKKYDCKQERVTVLQFQVFSEE